MADVYFDNTQKYNEEVTKKIHYQTLPVLNISLDGATEFMIRSEHEYRPDLVSLEVYGDAGYDDYITIANKLTDPIKSYTAGTTIYAPTLEAIQEAIDGTT